MKVFEFDINSFITQARAVSNRRKYERKQKKRERTRNWSVYAFWFIYWFQSIGSGYGHILIQCISHLIFQLQCSHTDGATLNYLVSLSIDNWNLLFKWKYETLMTVKSWKMKKKKFIESNYNRLSGLWHCDAFFLHD